MNKKSLEGVEASILRIGQVISVEDRTIEVEVDKLKNSSHLVYAGNIIKNTSVGGYVKIGKGYTWIIGKIEGERVLEDKDFSKKYYKSTSANLKRVLKLSLLGFLDDRGNFRRGIKELPLVSNECYLLTSREFKQIHHFVGHNQDSIPLGYLTYEKNQEIEVGVDNLFTSHFGIFGNTGSGKSYSLAKIYYELFKKYGSSENFKKNSKFIVIDFNGEYINAPSGNVKGSAVITGDTELKSEYQLSTSTPKDRFPLAEKDLKNPELWTIVLEATEKTQAPFLRRAIEGRYWGQALDNVDQFKERLGDLLYSSLKDADVNFDRNFATSLLSELQECFDPDDKATLIKLSEDYEKNLRWHSSQRKFYYREGTTDIWPDKPEWSRVTIDKIASLDIPLDKLSLMARIRLLIVLQYYSDTARGFANKEHLAPLIKRMDKRIAFLNRVFVLYNPASDTELTAKIAKPLQIISLRNVNIDMRKIIPMVVCKIYYDNKRKENIKTKHLNFVIDEAHNILSYDSTRESEQWRDYRLESFEEIIKEGRKFGTFLTIASQRPSDISATILSQLHNYLLHRLINDRDIHAVEKTVSYLDRLSFESMPILPTGVCILAGILAQIPVVVDIDEIPTENAPNNDTMIVTNCWKDDK